MNCFTFQDQLSDYLEGELDARAKAECAAHRLVCRDCRALYTDVRDTMTSVGELSLAADIEAPHTLNARILAATTTGEMLNCDEFDVLIERYFDGVLLAPEFQTFQNHFDHCNKCRRLLLGIEDAISLCRETKDEIVSPPVDLQDRIVAATSGKSATQRFHSILLGLWAALLTPQWAVALLIVAAALTIFSTHFSSFDEFKVEAQESALRLREDLTANGKQANRQVKQATIKFDALLGDDKPHVAVPNQPAASPYLQTVDFCQPHQAAVTAMPIGNRSVQHSSPTGKR